MTFFMYHIQCSFYVYFLRVFACLVLAEALFVMNNLIDINVVEVRLCKSTRATKSCNIRDNIC